MRTWLIAWVWVLLSSAHANPAPLPDAPQISVETLAPGVYLYRASSDLDLWTATNVLAVVNEEDVVVFDSNARLATARAIIKHLQSVTRKPVSMVINSHWHLDHWMGNAAWREAYESVEFIASSGTRDYMKRMSPRFYTEGMHRRVAAIDEQLAQDEPARTDDARATLQTERQTLVNFAAELEAAPRVLPTLTFDDRLVIERGTRRFVLFSVTGDASASAVLYLPNERIVATGDCLVAPEKEPGPPPWTTNSNAISAWLAGLERIDALDAEIIVPGQGPAFRDERYLKTTIRLYQAIITQVHAALEDGASYVEDVLARIDVDAIGKAYQPDHYDPAAFRALVERLVRKVHIESLDGVVRERGKP